MCLLLGSTPDVCYQNFYKTQNSEKVSLSTAMVGPTATAARPLLPLPRRLHRCRTFGSRPPPIPPAATWRRGLALGDRLYRGGRVRSV